MAYTHDLKQLIRRVEEARPQRLAKRREGWEFPRLNLAEKEDRLKQFHPSYKEDITHFTYRLFEPLSERTSIGHGL